MQEEDSTTCMLNDAISIGDLLKGSTFEINSNYTDLDDSLFCELEDTYKNYEDNDDENLCAEKFNSPWEKPFAELKESMFQLPNYNIYKKITKEGLSDHEPLNDKTNIRVAIHYNGYWEGESATFDSSYMRGHPQVFNLNEQQVLLGLELAVKSMRCKEEAQFIISYELLFGKYGCPPRIKPQADGLFIISLLKVDEIGNEAGLEQIPDVDRNKYSVAIEKIRDVYKNGKDAFVNHNYGSACRLFHKSLTALECCQLQNEEEQKEQHEFIIKLYTNLAICYNLLNLPKKTCLMCNEVARISNISQNCKILFQHGRALMKLGEFRRAQERLVSAQCLSPSNTEIANEIRLLADKFQQHTDTEKLIWQRAFQNQETNDVQVVGKSVSKTKSSAFADDNDEFRQCMRKDLEMFRKNNERIQMSLPPGLSTNELNDIDQLISEMDLKLVLDRTEKSFIIRKTTK